jgi:hypothetical protein
MTIPDFWRKIKKLNIYNLDGNQIENPDELADFCIYSAKILDELYNALNNNSDHKTIEEKINKLLSLFGHTNDLEDALKKSNEVETQIKNINNIFRVIGAIMIVIGVFSWHINIQRYIDIEYRKKQWHKNKNTT